MAARTLGDLTEAEMYRELADEVAEAFRSRYLLDSGRLTCDSQTAYAIAIAFDLLGDVRVTRRAGDRLAELVRDNGLPHRDRVYRHAAHL